MFRLHLLRDLQRSLAEALIISQYALGLFMQIDLFSLTAFTEDSFQSEVLRLAFNDHEQSGHKSGQMDGWVDGWMDPWMDIWVDRYMVVRWVGGWAGG